MSLIFMDGFDDNLTADKWTSLSGFSTSPGRTLNAMRIAEQGVSNRAFSVSSQHATMFFGFAMAVTPAFGSLPSSRFFRVLGDNNTVVHLEFEILDTASLQVRRGSGGTILGTTAPNLFTVGATDFFFYEIKVVLSDTIGEVQIRVNGVTVLNLTGIDTKNGGVGTVFDSFTFSIPVTSTLVTIIDDLYVLNGAGAVNNNFIGDCSVLTRFPDGNGFYSQGTGSDGNSVDNFLLVDENPPNTTDYVEFDITGEKDTYTFTNIPSGTVFGVQQAAFAAKSDAGARSVRNIQRIGGADFSSPDQGLSVIPTYVGKFDILEVSPATAVLWTSAEVNAAEFGTEARP